MDGRTSSDSPGSAAESRSRTFALPSTTSLAQRPEGERTRAAVPGLDAATVEALGLAPLAPPPPGTPPAGAAAAAAASTDAFRLAMIAAAALLVLGAAINLVGLRSPTTHDGTGTAGGGAPLDAPG